MNMNIKHCVWSSNLFKNSFEKLNQCFQQKRLSLKCAKLLRKRSFWSFHKCSASLETSSSFVSKSNNLQEFCKIFLKRLLNCKLIIERINLINFLNPTCLSFAFESILKAKLSATFFLLIVGYLDDDILVNKPAGAHGVGRNVAP